MSGENALDRASFYVDELKYGPGHRALEGATTEQVNAQMEVLLRGADVTSITGSELVAACDHYANVWHSLVPGLPTIIAKSLFMDGLMHGIALVGGLEGTRERLDELEKESK